MRVLHVLDHSLPLQSGYVFRTLGILQGQRDLGIETVHLTTPKHTAGISGDVETVDGWEFHRTRLDPRGLARLPVFRERAQMRATARRIGDIARRLRPDVLHAHSPLLNALPAEREGRRLGIPVVYEIRALWEDAAVDHGTTREGSLRYRLTRALETRAAKRALEVVTICEGLKRDFVARGLPAERITIVPNAVDLAKFPPAGRPDQDLKRGLGLDGAFVLGFLGSFYAYEGLALLLDAVPRLKEAIPGLKVLLTGGGYEEDNLREQARRLRIEDLVVFTGRVHPSEVTRYYDLVDLLVYPRLSMRLTEVVTPLKPLEAMAQKRIFLASDVGGHRELVRDGVTGFLFRAGDGEALADGVLRALQARDRWAAMGEAGRSFVESERNWRTCAERYLPVYERAVAAARRGS